jgi:predicted nuclease with TOPRIM domain
MEAAIKNMLSQVQKTARLAENAANMIEGLMESNSELQAENDKLEVEKEMMRQGYVEAIIFGEELRERLRELDEENGRQNEMIGRLEERTGMLETDIEDILSLRTI